MIKSVALQYAASGYRVLATYGIVARADGTFACTCPDPGGHACSPGKHPLFGSRGVHDATTDADTINAWPDDGINLGLACTDTFVVLDMDDRAIAAALLDPDLALRDQTTLSSTGRGLHIYLQCAPTKSGIIKRADTGARIGEVRANGHYVIAPPSMHYTGKQYAFLGSTLLESGGTQVTTDGWEYAKEVMSWIGVAIQDKSLSVHIQRPSSVKSIDLPFETNNASLMSQLQPTYPVTDRSASLFHLACDVLREAHAQSIDIDRLQVAGIIRRADEQRGAHHSKGAKYANRDNADDYYWDIAVEAERSIDQEAQETPQQKEARQAARGRYYYDESAGFIDNRRPNAPRRIANFEPKIEERIVHWVGSKDEDLRQYWRVRLQKGNEKIVIDLAPEEYEDVRKLERALRTAMPPHFIIEEKLGGQLDVGMREYSGVPSLRRAYSATGWLPNADSFLLPGTVGAITSTGFDTTVTYEPTKQSPQEMVLPRTFLQDVDLAQVCRTIFESAPPPVLIPILSQLLAAPLCSTGFDYRALMHVYGPSNTYKTSLCSSLISLYGYSTPGGMGIDAWSQSTEKAIQAKMHYFRDLPMLIDDFKAGVISDERMTAVVQGYGDTRGRSRMDRTLRVLEAMPPRGLMISTGEDIWNQQKSMLSRTIIVHVEEGMLSLSNMQKLDNAAKSGALGALGITWIRWLCSIGQEYIREYLANKHKELWNDIEDRVGTTAPRMISNLTALFTVSQLFSDFVRDIIPQIMTDWSEVRNTGWSWNLPFMKQQMEAAESATPLSQIINALSASISTGKACLQPRKQKDSWVGTQGSRVVGYVGDGLVWLSDWITFGWFCEERARERRMVTFGWDQIAKAARSKYPHVASKDPVYIHGRDGRARMTTIPFEVIERAMIGSLEDSPVD